MRIVVMPWGRVFIDSRLVGITPALKEIRVGGGLHELRVEHPSYPARVMTLDASDESLRRIEIDFDR